MLNIFRVSDIRVLSKMDVRCSIFKLLLFQMLVAWCGAKHIDVFRVEIPADVDAEVQDSIRSLVHNGIYSHRHLDPNQVQVVVPVRVSRDGTLVSRTLEHAHEHGHARARRDLHLRDHQLDHVLHYNLTVDGRDLRLDLRPSVTFITPAMMVERHTASGRTRHRPDSRATACHYTGSVSGQPASSIALSACDGLAGLLRTEQGEYWIEPSDQESDNSLEGRPHVIFRRSAVDKLAAWHRAKRAVDNRAHNNTPDRGNYNNRTREYSRYANRNRDNKEQIDRRRREQLVARRRRLEELRIKSPKEYRRQQQSRQQQLRLQFEQRRLQANHSTSTSASNSVEANKSLETKKRNKSKLSKEERRRNRRRRRRRTGRNCATKQPPYLWDKKNFQDKDNREQRLYKPNRRRPHHHQLSHHPDFEEPRRSTRSVSKPRHVEVLLVADKSMTDFHNESSLETYLLTIMNMVSSLYMDPSIGNYIKVVVVKIILVEEMQSSPGPGLSVSTNADATLASFCKWQHQLNPDDDSNPHHHDVAILVTRKDICSLHDSPCSTLGVAHVAGMCKPDRSCSVNEDNGIMLAHTITHELGHNFGLYHDTEKIGCHRREGSTLHIMTPIFEADTVQVAWSRCSKRDVTNFLDTGSGECLGDTPSQEDYEYPVVPAGVIFDAENQCHLQFGEESKVCAEPAELCEHLWCNVNNTCKTMLRPAAPGTTCGPDMWCQNMKCVARAPTPQPRDGSWGDWSEWSECSRTCGAGVQTKSRECNNPEPINSGKYCIGERSRYKICNTEACPIGEPSFREVQCQKKGNNGTEDWIPYFDQDKPCELLCSPMNGGPEFEHGFVADGTPCRQTDGARDMCIAGVCHKVGCDWIVDSEVKEDACGVCGGNGSTCNTVQGVYNKGTTKQTGFSEVAVIPAGSRNVRIKEKVNPVNFISIGSARSRRLYINGAHQNQPLTEYFVAGSQAIYERDRDWEKVRIPGPIAEDLKVYQHISSKNRNPVVTYKYTVDRAPHQRRKFRYKFSEWSSCSVTCGSGYRRRHYQCVDDRHRIVDQAQCYHIEQPRSDAMMEQCRRPACPSEPHLTHYWWTGQWGVCSRLCRMPGEESIKQRNVYCVDKKQNSIVNDSECPGIKPLTSIICADVPPC